MRKNEELLFFLRYFIGGLLAIYGLFAFLQPEKYSIALVPQQYNSFAGLVMLLIGFLIIFYKKW
jgi:hypothetical protein